MNRRKAIAQTLSALFIIGMALLLFVFGQAMRPTRQAVAALPRIDLSQLQPGEVKIVDDPTVPSFEAFSGGIVFAREENSSVRAWQVTLRAGHVVMPDLHWWRPFYECKDFGLVKGSPQVLACKDSNPSA